MTLSLLITVCLLATIVGYFGGFFTCALLGAAKMESERRENQLDKG